MSTLGQSLYLNHLYLSLMSVPLIFYPPSQTLSTTKVTLIAIAGVGVFLFPGIMQGMERLGRNLVIQRQFSLNTPVVTDPCAESCIFDVFTKELIDKASICDEETYQCTQIVQTSCVFEQPFPVMSHDGKGYWTCCIFYRRFYLDKKFCSVEFLLMI